MTYQVENVNQVQRFPRNIKELKIVFHNKEGEKVTLQRFTTTKEIIENIYNWMKNFGANNLYGQKIEEYGGYDYEY